MLVGIAFSFLIQKYTLDHLPFKDCLSFKVGNNILEKKKFDAGKKEIVMVHEKDGKEFTYTLPNYPTWIEDSTYVFKKRTEKVLSTGNAGDMILDFNLNSEAGTDTTNAVLSKKGKIFLFIITDIEEKGKYSWEKDFQYLATTHFCFTKVDTAEFKGVSGLIDVFEGKKYPLYIVTNRAEQARTFFAKFGVAPNHVFFCDEKPLLAAARTRPSIMVLEEGKILQKITLGDVQQLIN
jgi:hypothetical protein